MTEKIIFISIPWFVPAFKAGGPIQSIANMVNELKEGYRFYIYTSNADLHNQPIAVAITNEWVEYNDYTKVWYAGKQERSQHLVEQVKLIKPEVLYIIGLFDWHFNIVPLLYAEAAHKLLSVRGMLHPGALAQKAVKKKVFLQGLKWMKTNRKCSFHATDETEATYISNVFGDKAIIKIAANFPRLLPVQKVSVKEKGMLKLVSIGIISPMKNYLTVLQALTEVKAVVHYDIYGPVKEAIYWEECLQAIKALPSNITVEYHKEIPSHKVIAKLEGQHVFILPSKNENYGHAIVEALSAGLPVITSDGVPWTGLEAAGAGMNVTAETSQVQNAIEKFADMEAGEYELYCRNAVKYIKERIDINELKEEYEVLFNTNSLKEPVVK